MDSNGTSGNINIGGSSRVVVGDFSQEFNIQVGRQPPRNPKQVLLDSLTFDRWDARIRGLSTALDDTCQWLVAHTTFQLWLDPQHGAQHGGFLWLKGKPGSGKSTVMKEGVTWTKRAFPQHVVATYFFNARSPHELEKSSLGVYRLLTHQLLARWPEGLGLFTQMFSSKVRNGKMVEEWRVTELYNFWFEYVTHPGLPPLTMFVDALDEGKEDDVRSMIDNLVDLTRRSRSVDNVIRICLSSRHYPNITIDKCVSIVLEEQYEHRQDIELYVSEKLRGNFKSPMQDLRRQVLDCSNGVFLWVVLVVPILNRLCDNGYTAKMRAKQLERVPPGLFDVFNSLILRDSEDLQECITLLQWVLFSLRPLTPHEVCAALEVASTSQEDLDLSLDVEDRETLTMEMAQRRILHCSRGLVELTAEPNVQFIHGTVRDFLLGRNEITLAEANLTANHNFTANFRADHCHLNIAKVCLRYLTALANTSQSSETKLIEGYLTALTNGSQLSETDLIEYPLATYAAKYWWQHIRAVNYETSDDILAMATDLCLIESRLLTWVRNYDVETRSQWHSNPSFDSSELSPPLYYAAKTGFSDLVSVIVDRGADVDARGRHNKDTVLQTASYMGYEEIVQVLVNAGADVNVKGGFAATPLCEASAKGYENIVRILLGAGANIHAEGGNALYAAASEGYDKILQLLLDAGANVTAEGGITLNAASERGHEKIVRMLLDAGANVNAGDGNNETALQTASKNGHKKIVHLLITAGAEINAQGPNGTALYAASAQGHEQEVHMLLNAGADANAEGGNSLYAASARGHEKVVHMLLDAGADVNAEAGGLYANALRAAVRGGYVKIVRMLLIAGADVNAEGGTVLHAPSVQGSEQAVQILQDGGSNVPAEGRRPSTALQIALSEGHEEIVQMLLDAGAEVNAKRCDGTALYIASFKGYENLTQTLLDAGANVNAEGGFYGAALHVASLRGHENVVRVLVDAGADVNVEGERFGPALCAASAKGHEKVVDILLAAGARINDGGSAALCAASLNGHEKVVKTLLDNGADANTEQKFYGTALQAARRGGFTGIVQMLLEKGAVSDGQISSLP